MKADTAAPGADPEDGGVFGSLPKTGEKQKSRRAPAAKTLDGAEPGSAAKKNLGADAANPLRRAWRFLTRPRLACTPARGRRLFCMLVLLFVIGCVFGVIWEEALHLLETWLTTGSASWESRRGLLYGPFSPVYGLGAMVIYLAFCRRRVSVLGCFAEGALLGGGLEILLSLLQEWMFGTASWDYHNELWDIAGRTTIPFMAIWGLLAVVFGLSVFPAVERRIDRLPLHSTFLVCVVLTVVLAVDIGISVMASARQAARRAGQPASCGLELWLDQVYNDERMLRTYANAKYLQH